MQWTEQLYPRTSGAGSGVLADTAYATDGRTDVQKRNAAVLTATLTVIAAATVAVYIYQRESINPRINTT